MLQFRNQTDLAGTVFAAPDPDGVDTLYTVVKGTYDLDTGSPSAEQIPITLQDEFYGDPVSSSIRVPSDIALVKPGTDVMLIGQAHPPAGKGYYVDVSLRVGPLFKTVRVFGDRVWQSTGLGLSPSSPQFFESMPLIWEHAYGGAEETRDGVANEPRNPVGRGFRAPRSNTELEGTLLPNLEDPFDPITSPRQVPAPACFAPLCAHWQPRQSFAGTYDEAWQASRAPYLPDDFDPRFFHIAPMDLVVQGGYLIGGEPVELLGVSPAGPLRFALPAISVDVTYRVRGADQQRPPNLDTVILMPETRQVVLIWRAAFQCDKDLLRVEEVVADSAATA